MVMDDCSEARYKGNVDNDLKMLGCFNVLLCTYLARVVSFLHWRELERMSAVDCVHLRDEEVPDDQVTYYEAFVNEKF
jgi:hypothetical protein